MKSTNAAWILTISLSLLAAAGRPARADDAKPVLSDQEIVRALAPPATTRSFVPRGLARRQSSETDQSVNLNIPFELNSSALKPQASVQLKQLELALSSSALGSERFMVAGHTDSKGSAAYNKQLSLRRAETVKQFLIAKGLDAKRLDTVGYGSEHPLSPDRPEDAGNRRVEIRVLGTAAH